MPYKKGQGKVDHEVKHAREAASVEPDKTVEDSYIEVGVKKLD